MDDGKHIWEPNAMEKFAIERETGVAIHRREYEPASKPPEIKVFLDIDGKAREYEPESLLYIGVMKDSRKQDGDDVSYDVKTLLSGKLDAEHCTSIINLIHCIIEQTPNLLKAEREYQIRYLIKHSEDKHDSD